MRNVLLSDHYIAIKQNVINYVIYLITNEYGATFEWKEASN
jgi:hypothetical protein